MGSVGQRVQTAGFRVRTCQDLMWGTGMLVDSAVYLKVETCNMWRFDTRIQWQ